MELVIHRKVIFAFLLPVWILIRILIVTYNRKKGNKLPLRKEITFNIFIFYIFCVCVLTLFPLYLDFSGSRNGYISVNLVPVLFTLKKVLNITNNPDFHNFMLIYWIVNIFGNMFLLLPFGLLLPMLWNKFKDFKKIVLLGFCFSLNIETIQLLSGLVGNRGRTFDVDDILLNTIGAGLGFILFDKCLLKISKRKSMKRI